MVLIQFLPLSLRNNTVLTLRKVPSLITDFQYEYVTCGSVLKLYNTLSAVRLHSHDVKYGSGSGQQSVTGVDSSDDHNSYWQVRGKMGKDCIRG